MIELTVSGLSDDKAALVLADPEGAEFRLTLDHRMRALIDQTRRPAEATIDAQLRPRDIQMRVRAGESAEEIAERSGVPLTKVLPYALPVVDERRHVADRALAAAVRGGEGGVLGSVAAARLRPAGVHADQIEWDAWRREDGRWSVRATYFVDDDEQQADFVYDASGRYVLPDDAIARWLVGAATARTPATTPAGPPTAGHESLELSIDSQLDSGLDAGLDSDRNAHRRGLRAVSDLPIETTGADADWMVSEPATPSQRHTSDRETSPADAVSEATKSAAETSDERPSKSQLRARAKGRASVPTWDEIMFGSGDRG